MLDVPLPSILEQTIITTYLDRKTAEIDALLAQKERLIVLYEEEKTAVINQAVTKGLYPNAPLKDSGIDWLGEIPVKWELKKLKHLSKQGLKNGVFKKSQDFGSGTKLINVSDIYTDSLLVDENSLERVLCNEQEINKYAVRYGDILFVRSSLKREGIAKAACFLGDSGSIVFECHLIKISPSENKINCRYLNFYLNSSLPRSRLVSLSITKTMTTISQDSIGSLNIMFPSITEQTTIINHIDAEVTRVEAKITKTKRIIKLQKEYRAALISEVVTGRIKVSHLAGGERTQ
jgi:type I restriction enzyme S subunit